MLIICASMKFNMGGRILRKIWLNGPSWIWEKWNSTLVVSKVTSLWMHIAYESVCHMSQRVIESVCHMSQSGLVTNAMTQTHMSMWSLQALLIMAWFAMQCANTRLLAIHLHSPCALHPFSLWLLGQGQRWSHCLLVSYSLRNANTFTFFGDLCLAAWLLASSTQAARGSTSVHLLRTTDFQVGSCLFWPAVQ